MKYISFSWKYDILKLRWWIVITLMKLPYLKYLMEDMNDYFNWFYIEGILIYKFKRASKEFDIIQTNNISTENCFILLVSRNLEQSTLLFGWDSTFFGSVVDFFTEHLWKIFDCHRTTWYRRKYPLHSLNEWFDR